MLSLWKYTKKYRKEIILGSIFKFLEAIFELFLPFYMARLIDTGIHQGDSNFIIKTALTMFMMTVIGLVCVMICQYFASIASQGFGTEVRNQLIKKINTLDHSNLNQFGSETLITRMTSDVNQLQLALAMLIRLVVRAPFLSVGSLIMALYINAEMALVFLGALLIFCLILYYMMKRTVPLFKAVQIKIDQLNQVIQENLTGIRVIRAFSRTKREVDMMAKTSDDLAKSYINVANISALLNPATTLIMNGAIILLLFLGGRNVNIGNMAQGEVLALINYLIQMILALIVVSNLVVIFTRATASAGRVNEIFRSQPTILNNENGFKPLPEAACSPLSFENVSFRYTEKSGLALENITFTVAQGTTLGIIGPTGSGKSTLLQLISRFYDPSQGWIALNHANLPDWQLLSLRGEIGLVPQTSVLFSGSIRDNLHWGKPDATDEDCWKALAIAQCLDFTQNLPDGLDSQVLEGGKNFSGGQRQRLSIARAIIKKPKILLLDDSLSALDYQTDLEVRKGLRSHLADSLVIIVSQRISSVVHAEQLLVLSDGQQAALGNHETLLKTSAIYQELYYSQQEMEVLTDD